MKKFILILFTFIILSQSAYADNGDVAGNIYYTDIQTILYYAPITSYNIGGKTVIDAEILNWHYGFDVYWLADQRTLDITDKGGVFVSLQAMAGETLEPFNGKPGDIAGKYYETDIKTYLNGKEIESYNIGGRTFIVAEEMEHCGYQVDWKEDRRELMISKRMDFYVSNTELGPMNLMYDPTVSGPFSLEWRRGTIVEYADGTYAELIVPSNRVWGTGDGLSFIALSDLQNLFQAQCSLTERTQMQRTEWVNGITYEYESCLYTINFQFDQEIFPEAKATAENFDYEFEYLDPSNTKAERIDYVSLNINGEVQEITATYGRRSFPSAIYVLDGKIYLPAYVLTYLLDCNWAW